MRATALRYGISLVLLLVAAQLPAQPVPRRFVLNPLVVSGDAAAGTDTAFVQVERPKVDDAGNVVFVGELAPTGGPAAWAADKGIWFRESAGASSLVVRNNDAAPGAPAGMRFTDSANPQFRVGGAGHVTFITPFYDNAGPGGAPRATSEGGVYAWSPGGPLTPVAVTGAPVPGMPGVTFATPLGGYTRQDGATFFSARVAGPGISQSNDGVAFMRTPAGELRVLAQEGTPVAGTTVVFADTPEVIPFPRGERVAMIGNIGFGAFNKNAIVAGTPGDFAVVARSATVTGGSLFNTLHTLRVGGSDRIVFNGAEQFTESLYAATGAGDAAVVERSAGRQLSTGYYDAKVVNAGGQVVFSAFGNDPQTHGIFTAKPGGPVVPVALVSTPVPGSLFTRFLEFPFGTELQINDDGFVAFAATVDSPIGPTRESSLFLYREDFGLLPVALTGDSVEVRAGVYKQIRRVDSFSLNDQGVLVLGAKMTDGTSAILKAVVPEPGAVGIAALGAGLLLRRCRRSSGFPL